MTKRDKAQQAKQGKKNNESDMTTDAMCMCLLELLPEMDEKMVKRLYDLYELMLEER